MATVLVCDGARGSREGLRRRVATLPGVRHVSTAATGEELLARWPQEQPDLVLLGVRPGGGLGAVEATRRLVGAHPEATVVLVGGVGDREAMTAAICGGARGYLLADTSSTQLCAALAHALADPSPPAALPPAPRPAGDPPALTERELQVLRGMAAGRSNAAIGRTLYLSEDTVKTHARRLFRKLAANDRAQAVAAGFRWRLLH